MSQITFYNNHYSPYCHRVHITLEEVGAKYNVIDIDLANKPAWYTEKVNPFGTVPSLTYGGTSVKPEEPSDDSVKLWESLVIDEFLAELNPSARLIPTDAVKRANMRLFNSIVEGELNKSFIALLTTTDAGVGDALLSAIEAIQQRLPSSGFAMGEFTLADIAIAPTVIRLSLVLENEIGQYALGEGARLLAALKAPKFKRFTQYVNDLKAHPSIQKTYDEAKTLENWKTVPYFQRA